MVCSPNVNIDLHIHSTASDGSLTPAEIIARARHCGLAAIAITDHDTLAGVTEAVNSGIPSDLKFLTGVEISTAPPQRFPSQGSLHLLGYGINPDDDHLQKALARLQNARQDRNPRIIAKLNRLGIGISMTDLEMQMKDAQIGRPHIAAWLVENGIVADFDEAFERYLGAGRPAYADKYRIDCEAAIKLIRRAGGAPVLAHPSLIAPEGDWRLEDLVARLKTCGLMGIEAYYPEHTHAQTQAYLDWAQRFDLAATGGTDFHGAIKPDVEMGVAGGDFHVPYHCYTDLMARIAPQDILPMAPNTDGTGVLKRDPVA
ncbi:MAG: PHP domain-containing protein [Desulfobacterales bacterium]|nr:PHP domain-containing protein [Desulfobacterales bacterium]MDJ0875370.1 PHP domain-containing protein [Desulfobacterales bacterium]